MRKAIDKALDKYLPSLKEEPRLLHRAMRYSVFSGGKRIRPVLVIESCRACGGKLSSALGAACAVELVHTYSLIHDDLPAMDDDNFRRGKPSCHKAFGEAAAILAGDALLTLAFNIIAKNSKPDVCAMLVKVLSEAIGTKGMVGGQALDIGDRKVKNRQENINRLKTSKLFEASLKMGAVCARAGKNKIEALGKYGICLGDLFQLTDDIIDKESLFPSSYAILLCNKTKPHLKRFGRKAETLKKIADDILARA